MTAGSPGREKRYLYGGDAPAGWNINAVHTKVGEDGAVVLRGELLLFRDWPLLHLFPVLLVLPVRTLGRKQVNHNASHGHTKSDKITFL
jgi:hypothetical protein